MALRPLDEVRAAQREGAVVLDSRDPNEFAAGHLTRSVNIGLAGRYAEYAGGVIEPGASMILVTDGGMETEAKNRLARIGFDNVIGHLDDPVKAFSEHPDEVAHCKRYDVRALEQLMADVEDLQLPFAGMRSHGLIERMHAGGMCAPAPPLGWGRRVECPPHDPAAWEHTSSRLHEGPNSVHIPIHV